MSMSTTAMAPRTGASASTVSLAHTSRRSLCLRSSVARRDRVFKSRASLNGNGNENGSENETGGGQASGLYFVDKLMEDPVNALLVLGPRALAGAIDSLPKSVDEIQQETEQVRDRLAMLAQDPRPWDVKSELVVREADKQLEELVEKGTRALGDQESSGFSSATTTSSAGTSPAMTEEEEQSYQELSRKVAEFTNLYLLLQELKNARKKYEAAEEMDAKMALGILEDTKSSLSHRLTELSEGLEEDFDLPFKELIEEAKEACSFPSEASSE
ncbi:hypothetical protein HOP50_16g77470 [Chloropicon primus]|uniref:Uncharacterized protein n=1 Tax=Chloropicon primus TaxID=1764295 RepID=A0A5B8MXX4_9CHLO|nr:hypothetical protein A3770_16p77190 [Chloropicon primus]UPR04406.1 hypothetical protein HOP50_16g77470 [Chloropicon primus]|eukprot:QDZ25201.1 hypothetical protein A3770_16p77190 [Chloropicon primus]